MQYPIKNAVSMLLIACGVAGCANLPPESGAPDNFEQTSETLSSSRKASTAATSASQLRQATDTESQGGLGVVQHRTSGPKPRVDEKGASKRFLNFEDDPANRQLTIREGETVVQYKTRIMTLNHSKKPLSNSEMEVVRRELKKTPEGKAMDEALQRGKATEAAMKEQMRNIKTSDEFPSYIAKIRSVEVGDDLDTVVKKLGKPTMRVKSTGVNHLTYGFIDKDMMDPKKIIAGQTSFDAPQCTVFLDETDKVKSVTVTKTKGSGGNVMFETLYSKGQQ